jgi:hypothetical protein
MKIIQALVFLLIILPIPLIANNSLPDGVHITRDYHPETKGVESWLISSPYQTGTNKVEVLLPDSFDPSEKYPVVYCLPVNAGTKGNWGHPLTEARRGHLPDMYRAIFVCPSFPILPWYGNNCENSGIRENDHILRAVIPFIESRYPVRKNGRSRYLIGFSKSAIGALSLFFKQEIPFAKVAVFENWYGKPNCKQWNTWGFKTCYGTRENLSLYNPQDVVARYGAQFSSGAVRVTVMGGGPGKRIGVEKLMKQLSQMNIPHFEIWERSMGHSWTSGWLPLAVASLFTNPEPNVQGAKRK